MKDHDPPPLPEGLSSDIADLLNAQAPWPPLLWKQRLVQLTGPHDWENMRGDRFRVVPGGPGSCLVQLGTDDAALDDGADWFTVFTEAFHSGSASSALQDLIAACEGREHECTSFAATLPVHLLEELDRLQRQARRPTPSARRLPEPSTTYTQAEGCPPLDAVRDFFRDYVVLPDPWAYDAMTLWAAHTWLPEEFQTTPRLGFVSPQRECGKTRALELLALVCQQPRLVVNTSAPGLFRMIDASAGAMTLLLDEVDTIFQPGNGAAEDIRAMLNSGYKRGGTVVRVRDKGHGFRPQTFNVFGPVALGGIGDLPETLASRSIVITMRRRLPAETVKAWLRDEVEVRAKLLTADLIDWTEKATIQPDVTLPASISDRAAECWGPLIRIADAAGGSWPTQARAAAVAAVAAVAASQGDMQDDTAFLSALRDVFDDVREDRLYTDDLIERIKALDYFDARNLDAISLAKKLRPYAVRPTSFRSGEAVRRGYYRQDFEDTWNRYLQ